MPVFFGIYEKSRQKLTSTIGMIDVGKVYVFGFFLSFNYVSGCCTYCFLNNNVYMYYLLFWSILLLVVFMILLYR